MKPDREAVAKNLSSIPGCNPACRACHYKDLDYVTQLDRKNRWARTQLAKWQAVLEPILPAPVNERLGYRSKSWLRTRAAHHLDADAKSAAEFRDTCGAELRFGQAAELRFGQAAELRFGQAAELRFGMTRAVRILKKWEQEFVSWESCPLHHPAINQFIAAFKQALAPSLPADLPEHLAGIWFGLPHIVLIAKSNSVFAPLKDLSWPDILCPPFLSVWGHVNPQVGRKVFSHQPLTPLYLANPTPLNDSPPVRAFRQVATTLLNQARSQALEWLLQRDPSPVLLLDLYSGSGELAQRLPRETGWIGIELSRHASEYANTLRLHDNTRIHRSFVGTVEERLADPKVRALLTGPLAIYLNPPRTGLQATAFEQIAGILANRPEVPISYLSCSASSLGRDLRLFESIGYAPKRLQPYDFFPHTEHFEILAELTKSK